jgi:hypothetical protein
MEDAIKQYLYDTLTDEQRTNLAGWIDALKKNGMPQSRHGYGISITEVLGTYSPMEDDFPLCVTRLLKRAHTEVG